MEKFGFKMMCGLIRGSPFYFTVSTSFEFNFTVSAIVGLGITHVLNTVLGEAI